MEGRTPDNYVMAVSEFDEDIDNPTLQQSLEILYNIARDRRQKRLQDAAFVYDVNETKEARLLADTLTCGGADDLGQQ